MCWRRDGSGARAALVCVLLAACSSSSGTDETDPATSDATTAPELLSLSGLYHIDADDNPFEGATNLELDVAGLRLRWHTPTCSDIGHAVPPVLRLSAHDDQLLVLPPGEGDWVPWPGVGFDASSRDLAITADPDGLRVRFVDMESAEAAEQRWLPGAECGCLAAVGGGGVAPCDGADVGFVEWE